MSLTIASGKLYVKFGRKFVPVECTVEQVDALTAERDAMRAELARVRSAIPLDGHDEKLLDAVQCHKDDPVRSVVEWGAIRRTVEYIRAALAQTTQAGGS